MKRMQDIDFTKTYGNPPPSFEHRVQYALRKTEEADKPMRKASLRVVLITALIIAAMTTVAVAASQLMGWTEYFGQHYRIGVPQAALDEMHQPEVITWEVGPLTFTAHELLTDGHIGLSSVTIRTTDGSPALICSDFDHTSPISMYGENSEALAHRLGVDPDTSWVEAAKMLGLPLYSARAMMEAPFEYSGSAMYDAMWNEDNSLSFLCMAIMDKGTPVGQLPVTFYLRADAIDLNTAEASKSWIDHDQVTTLPVSPLLAEKTYEPQGEADILGFTLQRIEARQYATGVYLDVIFTAPEGVERDTAYDLYPITLTDAYGHELPFGMNLSLDIDKTDWPKVVLQEMIGVEKMPETIVLSLNEETVTVK